MTKIFLDCASLETIREFRDNPLIAGYTTNPSLMLKAGVRDYEKFCKEVLAAIGGKPVSFEVFADEFSEMERQARIISSWGENVFVKIPITNTRREPSDNIVAKLTEDGIKVNITAILGLTQVMTLPLAMAPMIVSVFAGRIADTGIDPIGLMRVAKSYCLHKGAELLWASPREVLNIYQAEEAGADIITCTPELIRKYEAMKGKDLNELSLATVKMFYSDGKAAGYKL